MTTMKTIDQITTELTTFYAPAGADQRPDADGITYMAEQLHEAGLDLETATTEQLNALARGESI